MSVNPFCEIALEASNTPWMCNTLLAATCFLLLLVPPSCQWQLARSVLLAPLVDVSKAAQEAVRLKEKKIADEVVAVSIGSRACQVMLCSAWPHKAGRYRHVCQLCLVHV